MNTEIWRDIPGFEGLYQVSDQGAVKRLAGTPKCKADRLLRPIHRSNGYLFVTLSKEGGVEQVDVHRLVMWAFVGSQGSLWVNHINGIKTDNRVSNLEYVTPSQNTKHAYDMGLKPKPYGESNGAAQLTEERVRLIRLAFSLCGEDLDRTNVAEQFAISKTALSDVLAERSWKGVK